MRIPFNRPHTTGLELEYIRRAYEFGHFSGDGPFSRRCQSWITEQLRVSQTLLTSSGTSALEMIGLLLDLKPGDEVIMPSFTFVSTANAFVLRGATPVFVDIRPDTLNLDETKVEEAITPRTRAVVAVHYAGVACEMDRLREICRRHQLKLIEDAAHGMMARYRGKPLGSLGDLAALSFHETKNVTSGEGGALLIMEQAFIDRAEVIWQKGTDRRLFLEGRIDKYTWTDVGSSFPPSELQAAFLFAQLEQADVFLKKRHEIWGHYHSAFADMERRELCRRPVVPADCEHNAHLYYLLLRDQTERDRVLKALLERGIQAVFHYVPLHSSPAGEKYGRISGKLTHTDELHGRLIRLPMWVGMGSEVDQVVSALHEELTD